MIKDIRKQQRFSALKAKIKSIAEPKDRHVFDGLLDTISAIEVQCIDLQKQIDELKEKSND